MCFFLMGSSHDESWSDWDFFGWSMGPWDEKTPFLNPSTAIWWPLTMSCLPGLPPMTGNGANSIPPVKMDFMVMTGGWFIIALSTLLYLVCQGQVIPPSRQCHDMPSNTALLTSSPAITYLRSSRYECECFTDHTLTAGVGEWPACPPVRLSA